MTRFDTVLVVDWSARSAPSPRKPSADAIWLGIAGAAGTDQIYKRTRAEAATFVEDLIAAELAAGRRMLIGFDFPFGFPAGFAERLTGHRNAFAVWEWLAGKIRDEADNKNNRFEIADRINSLFPGTGPFWRRPASVDAKGVPERGSNRAGHGLSERRFVERRVKSAQSVWKLHATGSVGSQSLMGLPRLWQLRQRYAGQLSVWPFETNRTPIVLAEIYPSLLAPIVTGAISMAGHPIKGAHQVRLLSRALFEMSELGTLELAFDAAEGPDLVEEGWILGVGAETELLDAARSPASTSRSTPSLRNDCFALPAGVNWVPVDQALESLRASLSVMSGTHDLPLAELRGRTLAQDVNAARANPPAANSAVDGYGVSFGSLGPGAQTLPLADGRAAAGEPFTGKVPPGQAIRILTGALLPDGVDTVVLQEDVEIADGKVAFQAGIRSGANTRKAGEDVEAGAEILKRGRRLSPQDCALLAATGCTHARVFTRLRAGLLSTGDEVVEPGSTEAAAKTYDANRPMLSALVSAWGHAAVDLGHVGDDRNALRERLDGSVPDVDVILTSGGVSAGDEDHVSALLKESGSLSTWRVAVKPGRPLALGVWKGVPVFGLPGNPVAAFVCSLIFARPALEVMGGGQWSEPLAMTVPAAFEKRKKAGRREYLRARLTAEGHAEVFRSEGSGRISGLSWATGLVELDDASRTIQVGDLVRFLPFAGFGI